MGCCDHRGGKPVLIEKLGVKQGPDSPREIEKPKNKDKLIQF